MVYAIVRAGGRQEKVSVGDTITINSIKGNAGDSVDLKPILVVDGSNKGERADLDQAPILIGRGSDAAIRLDDDYVSTRHARIASSGDQWFVEDLGSTNGTYIGSARITQPTTLTLGTQVRIGKTLLELRK